MDLRTLLAHAPPSPVAASVDGWMRSAPQPGPWAVAYSGGADSTALLVEVARRSASHDAQTASTLFAFHVHHGLQPAADDFLRHGEAFCRDLEPLAPVRFVAARVEVALPPGASVEAQAREARYAALAAMAREHGVSTVLLGHHADDQVETMLIALSRGGGIAGLAGMRSSFDREGTHFARPLLEVPGPAIRAWLEAAAIPFVDDPTNADERFTRNRLRRRVISALDQALPTFRETFARSARLARQAQALVEELAAEDARKVGDPPLIQAVQRLSSERQANVLRHWLRLRHATTPSEAQLVELLDVTAACVTRAHRIDLRVGRGHVRREGDRLRFDADA